MAETAAPPTGGDTGPVVVHEIVAPDGTQYRVYADGSWVHEAWDGTFVRDDENSSTTPEEVLAKLADAAPVMPHAEANWVVCPDGTQFLIWADGTWDRRCWDGSYVSNHEDASTTPEEVRAKYGL